MIKVRENTNKKNHIPDTQNNTKESKIKTK